MPSSPADSPPETSTSPECATGPYAPSPRFWSVSSTATQSSFAAPSPPTCTHTGPEATTCCHWPSGKAKTEPTSVRWDRSSTRSPRTSASSCAEKPSGAVSSPVTGEIDCSPPAEAESSGATSSEWAGGTSATTIAQATNKPTPLIQRKRPPTRTLGREETDTAATCRTSGFPYQHRYDHPPTGALNQPGPRNATRCNRNGKEKLMFARIGDGGPRSLYSPIPK